MFKFSKAILVCLFILTGVTPSNAGEEEKRALIIEVIELTNVLDVFDDMKSTAGDQFEAAMKASGLPITPAQMEATKDIMFEIFDEIKPDLVALTIRVHNDNYSEAELRQMVEFYKTDLGQMFINKVPQIVNQTMLETQNLMASIQPELHRRIGERLQELEAETTS